MRRRGSASADPLRDQLAELAISPMPEDLDRPRGDPEAFGQVANACETSQFELHQPTSPPVEPFHGGHQELEQLFRELFLGFLRPLDLKPSDDGRVFRPRLPVTFDLDPAGCSVPVPPGV
jgi:hypothetical protein